MIINNSRQQNWDSCKVRTYNWDELRLVPQRVAFPLLLGSAYHAGMAAIMAKQSLETAVAESETEYRKRAGDWPTFLPEETKLYEDEIRKAKLMVQAYAEHYVNEDFQVLAPEIKFQVPLPGSEHHCYYIHRMLHPDPEGVTIGPKEQKPSQTFDALGFSVVQDYACHDERCYVPHYLSGTTDAIIQWKRMVWLMEHKTTAYDLYNNSAQSRNWINDWYLNTQATAYIYGIWKSIAVQPHGAMLNVIIKPRANAANPVYGFYREPFLRSTDQLLRYEREIVRVATDYEHRMRTGDVWMNPKSCMSYNRKCDYWDSCISGTIEPQQFTQRSLDYVEAGYYKILGIEPPVPAEELKEETSVE